MSAKSNKYGSRLKADLSNDQNDRVRSTFTATVDYITKTCQNFLVLDLDEKKESKNNTCNIILKSSGPLTKKSWLIIPNPVFRIYFPTCACFQKKSLPSSDRCTAVRFRAGKSSPWFEKTIRQMKFLHQCVFFVHGFISYDSIDEWTTLNSRLQKRKTVTLKCCVLTTHEIAKK